MRLSLADRLLLGLILEGRTFFSIGLKMELKEEGGSIINS